MTIASFEGKTPRIGAGTYVHPSADVFGDVTLGEGCWIGPGARIRGDYGTIVLGDHCSVEDNCVIHARPGEQTTIGNWVTIGHGSVIHNVQMIHDYVIIGMGASTDSKVNRMRFNDHDFAAICDYLLLKKAVDAADRKGVNVRVGNIYSADLFYTPQPVMFDLMEKLNIIAVFYQNMLAY